MREVGEEDLRLVALARAGRRRTRPRRARRARRARPRRSGPRRRGRRPARPRSRCRARAGRRRSARRRRPARCGPSSGRRRSARPSRAASSRRRAPRARRRRRRRRVTTTRPTRAAPSPSRTMSSASWRSSASSASPKRSSSSVSGAISTPLAPLHMSSAVSFVESWPSTEMRSKERLTVTPSSRSAVSALERGVGLHEAEHRREARLDHARALRLRAEADGAAAGSVDVERRALLEGVGGHDRRGEVGVAVGAQLPGGAREAAHDRLRVERDADDAGRGDRDLLVRDARGDRRGALHLRRVVEAAAAGGGVRVAGVRRRRRAGRRAARARFVTTTGAASTPERVNRAALVASRTSQTSRPTSGFPDAFRPAATPAARKPSRQAAAAPRRRRRAPRPSASGRTWTGARSCRRSRGLVEAEHEVEVLDGLRRGALPEVVDRGEDEDLAGALVQRARRSGTCSCRGRRGRRAAFRRPPRTARRA